MRTVAALLLLLATPALAADLEIQEWEVPWEKTRPRDPYVAPDGRVWFVGQTGDYLASLDPKTGRFEKLALEENAAPHNLIVAEDGTVWYAGNRGAYIGRVDPKTKKIRRIPMPDPAARDPHTLAFAPDGSIWFTVQGGNYVGHLDTASEEIRLVKLPKRGSRPYGIVVAPDGRPWFNEFGANRIGTIDPATMKLREYESGRGARPADRAGRRRRRVLRRLRAREARAARPEERHGPRMGHARRSELAPVRDDDRRCRQALARRNGPATEPPRRLRSEERDVLRVGRDPERRQHGPPHGVPRAEPHDLVRHGSEHDRTREGARAGMIQTHRREPRHARSGSMA